VRGSPLSSGTSGVRVVLGGGPLTPVIKGIIIACVAVFLLQAIAGGRVEALFALSPAEVVYGLRLWQPLTYLFLHDPSNILHLVFNMLMLWMFGTELERHWGSVPFLRFYLICGAGAGLLSIALDPVARLVSGTGPWFSEVGTIGASGAIYGLLAAQGMLFPDRMLMVFLFFPMRMRPAVLLMAGITFYAAWLTPGSGINHIAHLGGMAIAWLILRRAWNLRQLLADWRWERRRRRYRVVADLRDDDFRRLQ